MPVLGPWSEAREARLGYKGDAQGDFPHPKNVRNRSRHHPRGRPWTGCSGGFITELEVELPAMRHALAGRRLDDRPWLVQAAFTAPPGSATYRNGACHRAQAESSDDFTAAPSWPTLPGFQGPLSATPHGVRWSVLLLAPAIVYLRAANDQGPACLCCWVLH